MDFTSITLNAAAKAMADTVLPALVDAGQRQALEQAHLVWDAVTFCRDRVDLIAERRRTEALDLTALVSTLVQLDSVRGLPVRAGLEDIHRTAFERLNDAGTSAEECAELIRSLGETLNLVLDHVDKIDARSRSEVERLILEHALRRLELDRSWLLPMGFDPEPAKVQDLRALLRAR